jgi:uroporphyrin-III C-methyltransferase / precorrin-2 dehydrogenase / sirohydrochlorin ferrochelatase
VSFDAGCVSLVGAGPGDPDLLTRRAADRLTHADMVFYDALVDPRVLDLAPRAQRVFVGKRAGRHAMRQETINALLIRAARRGRRVVRLKGGDPFVFGRGGEEALALASAGVGFEVVPGVSSAVAAPALAQIPVTHRGISSAFVVVSGHAESAYRPVLESLAPGSATIVVMMGMANAGGLASLLIGAGWSRLTPVAIVAAASTEAEQVTSCLLAELPVDPRLSSGRPRGCRGVEGPDTTPATIVIGEVVRVRGLLANLSAPPRAERANRGA